MHAQEVVLRAAAHGSAAGAVCHYRLAALLLYRSEHWVTLVRHGAQWYLANDASVEPAGASFASARQTAAEGVWAPSLALYAARPRDAAACAGAGGPWDPIGLKMSSACEGDLGGEGWEQQQRRPRKGRA